MAHVRPSTVAVALAAAFAVAPGTRAVAPTAVPACGYAQFELRLALRGSRRGVEAGVDVRHVRGRTCVVRRTLVLSLRYRDGSLVRSVRGNPGRSDVRRTIRPGHRVHAHTWVWRNWCHGASPPPPFLVAARAGPNVVLRAAPKPPRCERRDAASVLQSGVRPRPLPPPGDRIPARILASEAPNPLSEALIRVTNKWLVSDGRTLVAVYAGSAGNDPAQGLFAIVRQDFVRVVQTCRTIQAGRMGAVTITRAPLGRKVETSAQRGDLRFVTAAGVEGILHLADDSVELPPGTPLAAVATRC